MAAIAREEAEAAAHAEAVFSDRAYANAGLQLADLVVGATRELINFSLGKAKEDSFGVQRFKSLFPISIKHQAPSSSAAA